jgi:hypothetical protein
MLVIGFPKIKNAGGQRNGGSDQANFMVFVTGADPVAQLLESLGAICIWAHLGMTQSREPLTGLI